ncbi:hypothetical protein MRB53_006218 [Persea americana]|uniref:Uncharacterized protein n=1 Tax=Persea americana TaxID=3435 RepID=A0ACC2MFJ7_PERAE|nr:hypothetical protein MRB53_006218 [Persea americana]
MWKATVNYSSCWNIKRTASPHRQSRILRRKPVYKATQPTLQNHHLSLTHLPYSFLTFSLSFLYSFLVVLKIREDEQEARGLELQVMPAFELQPARFLPALRGPEVLRLWKFQWDRRVIIGAEAAARRGNPVTGCVLGLAAMSTILLAGWSASDAMRLGTLVTDPHIQHWLSFLGTAV